MSLEALNILADARQLLLNEGWCVGKECEWKQGVGMTYCSLGAILKAAGELKVFQTKGDNGEDKVGWRRPNWHNLSYDALVAIEILAHQLGDKFEPIEDFAWCAVEDFNDEKDRTLGEVLDVFDKAIEEAKKRLSI